MSSILIGSIQCDDFVIQTTVTNNQHSNLAGWILLGLFVAVIILDIWLYKTHRPTISQWLYGKTKHSKLLKIIGISLIGLLLYHLFFRGPFGMIKTFIDNIKFRYKQWRNRKTPFPKLVNVNLRKKECQEYPGPIKKVTLK